MAEDLEVFLSFRGPDTRQGLTSVLRSKMKENGIRVFYDDESILKGDEIDDALKRGIEKCQIYVPVLSKSYASSKACLQELAVMVKCWRNSNGRKKICPIFCVSVDDVKLKTDLYKQDLEKHHGLGREAQVEQWKDALMAVAEIKGWTLNYTDGYVNFCDSVSKDVLRQLETRHLTSGLVGIEEQVERVKGILDIETGDVRFLVIRGDRGIGKTTLANAIFDKLWAQYEGHSFVSDIREAYDGYKYIEEHLLRDIPNDDSNVLEGFKERFQNKKVLIVLDDVDEKEHVKKLNSVWFGPGSRIIVTTTKEDVLAIPYERPKDTTSQQQLLHKEIIPFEMVEMTNQQAVQLFSRRAFGVDSPPESHQILFREAVLAVGQRLPLTLEIIGSFLHRKDKGVWSATIEKLKETNREATLEKLKVIYDNLDDKAKHVFLDVACFYGNMEQINAVYMWKSYGADRGMEILKCTSLIKVVGNKFWMHDEVRDIGRKIVCEESWDVGKRSRLWEHEEAWNVLQRIDIEGKENLEAVGLSDNSERYPPKDLTLPSDKFIGLKNLRFLRLYFTNFRGNLKELLPRLRWLSWHHFHGDLEATNLSLVSLVVLQLSQSSISNWWSWWDQLQMADKLQVLELRGCQKLMKIPNLCNYKNLERLILEDCKELDEIDGSIGELKDLKCLIIKGCGSLTRLPDAVGSLEALMEIIIEGSGQHFTLPDRIGELKSLMVMVVANVSLPKLPKSIRGLQKLERLSLSRCLKLKRLPGSVGNLKSLVELDISYTKIVTLPYTIKHLRELTVLKMQHSSIRKFPREIWELQKIEEIYAKKSKHLQGDVPEIEDPPSNLRILDLSYTGVAKLPQSLCLLLSLQALHLDHCKTLQFLKGIPENLLSMSIDFESLPEQSILQKLNSLTDLVIFTAARKCDGAETSEAQGTVLSSIGKLPKLEHLQLDIPCPPSLVALPPDFCASAFQLKFLKLSCKNMPLRCRWQLPKNLSKISLSFCLLGTPQIRNLEKLSFLELDYCEIVGDGDEKFEVDLSGLVWFSALQCNFNTFKEFSPPKKLRILRLIGCQFSSTTLKLLGLKFLRQLELSECQGLVLVQGIEELKNLQELCISRCESLEGIEGDASILNKLRKMTLESCERLTSVNGLSRIRLENGEGPSIVGCPSLRQSRDRSRRRNKLFYPRLEDEDSS